MFRRVSTAVKLTAATVPIVASLFIAASIVDNVNGRMQRQDDLKRETAFLATTIAKAMTTPLWNYDVGTANDILAGLSGHPDFAGIVVTDKDNRPFASAGKIETRQTSVTVDIRADGKEAGKLTLAFSEARIQAEMRTEIVAIAETSRNIQEAASGMQHVSDGISGVGKNTSVILSVSNDVARITCTVKDHTCNLAIQVESLVEELRKGLSG